MANKRRLIRRPAYQAVLTHGHLLHNSAPPAGSPWSRRDWRELKKFARAGGRCVICGAAAGALINTGRGLVFLCPDHTTKWRFDVKFTE
jgi:hypothetical protein